MRRSFIYTDEEISQHLIDKIIELGRENNVVGFKISNKAYELLKKLNLPTLMILSSSTTIYVTDNNNEYTIETIPKEDKMEIKVNNLTDEQIKQVAEIIKKFEEENSKPKSIIDYRNGFIINGNGIRSVYAYTRNMIDVFYSIGLYRDTKQECEKLIRKMQIEHRLREWSKLCKDKIDWLDSKQSKWYIYCDIESGTIYRSEYHNLSCNDIYFTDKSILERAIADIGEQNLINNYFVEV